MNLYGSSDYEEVDSGFDQYIASSPTDEHSSVNDATDLQHYADFCEPSTLDYARRLELSLDYSKVDALRLLDISVGEDVFEDAWNLDSAAATALLRESCFNEKLNLASSAQPLLIQACRFSESPNMYGDIGGRKAVEKLENPLFLTDHAIDVIEFKIMGRDRIGLISALKELPVSSSEGLDWAPGELNCRLKIQTKCSTEKLVVSRKELDYLGNIIRTDFDYRFTEKIINDNTNYRKTFFERDITPPLFPEEPQIEIDFPSSSACNLELSSEQTNSVAEEAQAISAVLIKDDTKVADRNGHGEAASDPMLLDAPELEDLLNDTLLGAELPSSPPAPRRNGESIKIESPLLLAEDTLQVQHQSAEQRRLLNNDVLDVPSTFDNGDDLIGSQNSFDDFFKDEIFPIGSNLIQKLNQEELQEADTTKKLEVPAVDFKSPCPPWKIYALSLMRPDGKISELGSQQRMLEELRETVLSDTHLLPQDRSAQYMLQWSPFPSELGRLSLAEKLTGDFEKYVAPDQYGGCIGYNDLIWKTNKLLILKDDDDCEEELERARLGKGTDLNSLLRKRMAEYEEEPSDKDGKRAKTSTGQKSDGAAVDRPCSVFKKQLFVGGKSALPHSSTPQARPVAKEREGESAPSMTGLLSLSASDSLRLFLQTRGIAETEAAARALPVGGTVEASEPYALTYPQEKAKQHGVAVMSKAAYLPPTPTSRSREPILVSATLLTSLTFMRHLKRLFPEDLLIERDFLVPGSPLPEADILLSPRTGIILVALQKLHQKPLPGQKAAPDPTQRRLGLLAPRHERLLVLVHEMRALSAAHDPAGGPQQYQQQATHTLDGRDARALARLAALAGALECDAEVAFAPGGPEHLARWVRSAAAAEHDAVVGARRAGRAPGVAPEGLLAEESRQEVFLRRAGFNAYAAHAVLAAAGEGGGLGRSESVSESGSSAMAAFAAGTWTRGRESGRIEDGAPAVMRLGGLAAFVLMGREERRARFARAVGGRVLERVETVLEERWPCAREGFC